jgi:hypothetical protein
LEKLVSNFQILNIPIDSVVSEAKEYAATEIANSSSIRPLLTLYRNSTKSISIQLRAATDTEDRFNSLAELSFAAAQFNATEASFILDSSCEALDAHGNDIQTDAIISCVASKVGAEGRVLPYSIHPDDALPIWQDDNYTFNKDIVDANPQLLAFLASLFFFSGPLSPWSSYLKYLESKGANVFYHGSLTRENFGQTLQILI